MDTTSITETLDKINIINVENTKTLNQILERLDKLEKTYISMNSDLITQNIKMSEIVNGKLKEPYFEMPNNSNESNNNTNTNTQDNNLFDKTKELFFYEKDGKFIIYGSGTFDNRDKIKSLKNCEWNSINKTWDIITTKDKILEVFPDIIEKCMNQ